MDTPWACDYFPDLLTISSQRVLDVKQTLRCCEFEHCDGKEKEEFEKHLVNAGCEDWQQKTRAGNATTREFVPVPVNS